MSAFRFLVSPAELDGEEVRLQGAELRHLRARRLAPGAEIVVVDGRGRERHATVLAVRRSEAVLRFDEDQTRAARVVESPLQLTLAQAALKADKLDFVVEKATELGVTDIVIFISSRCVARPISERRRRWERLAQSATKQCGRTHVPSIRGPMSFDEFLGEERRGPGLLFWEGAPEHHRLLSTAEPRTLESVVATVGPEGGFSLEETEAAGRAGFQIVSLGPRILRAETAALVATTLCQSLWGDLSTR